uniref:Trigger factor ribosome-binding bacterial domain-containing protein n=3 Tax=Ditylum brightwellii TaxID=49249 RepID=A0A7S1ZHR2_9STRA|mmetsp:Transcript_67720/g.100383  ORF Transcript_67720/g.100383 Transcript_67720/m.100383 type:complete len:263 (-) Transcript_67720:72-860(-)
MMMNKSLVLLVLSVVSPSASFVTNNAAWSIRRSVVTSSSSAEWTGDVVSNTPDGQIRGCSITPDSEDSTLFTISIDGVEADLGKFSEAIYKKITSDAKQQSFQGFRPGTIPPHLQPTYRAFAMDECAREATLEAMEQNNIRPFQDARENLEFSSVSIPPPAKKAKKKKGGRKKKGQNSAMAQPAEVVEEPQWLLFDGMKEALDAGWKPGQSFSFVVKGAKGQKLRDESSVAGAKAIGSPNSAIDLNRVDVNSLPGGDDDWNK